MRAAMRASGAAMRASASVLSPAPSSARVPSSARSESPGSARGDKVQWSESVADPPQSARRARSMSPRGARSPRSPPLEPKSNYVTSDALEFHIFFQARCSSTRPPLPAFLATACPGHSSE